MARKAGGPQGVTHHHGDAVEAAAGRFAKKKSAPAASALTRSLDALALFSTHLNTPLRNKKRNQNRPACSSSTASPSSTTSGSWKSVSRVVFFGLVARPPMKSAPIFLKTRPRPQTKTTKQKQKQQQTDGWGFSQMHQSSYSLKASVIGSIHAAHYFRAFLMVINAAVIVVKLLSG